MDLTTTYLGLELRNPLIASSSPLTRDVVGIRRLEDAGAATVVLPSLFEEQVEQEMSHLHTAMEMGVDSYSESLSYFPQMTDGMSRADEYLEVIERAKKHVGIPIIASLNGCSSGGWMRYASMAQEAGADALELNIYYMTTDPSRTGNQAEARYLDAVASVLNRVTIPVAVKIGPFFSSLPKMASRFAGLGAKGLVLFNRFYQPDIDIETLQVTPALSLSRSEDMRLPLRWAAVLYGRVGIDLAISTGVHTSTDVIKAIMAGASVTMMASELLQNGAERIPAILQQVNHWMHEHEYESIRQMRGSMSQVNVDNPDAFERANYIRVLESFRYNPLSLPQ